MEKDSVEIIIPVYNQISYTQECVDSILKNTKVPFKFIFIDNGSTDGTFEWLKKLESKPRVIRNEKNLGVVKAWNQGLDASQAEYLVFLNNDVIVAPNWLEEMLKILKENSDIWCVCPDYTRLDKPANFPDNFRPLQVIRELKRLIGFAFMVRSIVFKKLGKFDEQFEMAWFEDDDFYMRLKKVGHPPVQVLSSYIHHYESKTIYTIPDIEKYMAENKRRFEKKWSFQNN